MTTSSSPILSRHQLSSMIEHTILGTDITEDRIIAHLNEARDLGVFGVCIPLSWVAFAKKYLAGSSIKIVTVIDNHVNFVCAEGFCCPGFLSLL